MFILPQCFQIIAIITLVQHFSFSKHSYVCYFEGTSLKVISNLQVRKVPFLALWTMPKELTQVLGTWWHYSIILTFKTWKLQHITAITLPALLNGFYHWFQFCSPLLELANKRLIPTKNPYYRLNNCQTLRFILQLFCLLEASHKEPLFLFTILCCTEIYNVVQVNSKNLKMCFW